VNRRGIAVLLVLLVGSIVVAGVEWVTHYELRFRQ